MHFFKIPRNNLANRPIRTVITCMGVALGVACFISLMGLSRGVERAWVTGLTEKGTHILAMRKGAAEILAATLDQRLRDDIKTIEGIDAVSEELIELYQLDAGATVLISGWAADSTLWQTLQLSAGPHEVKLSSGELVMGQSMVTTMGFKLGQTIGIGGRDYTIKAINKSRGALNNNMIVMGLDDLQQITGKAGRVTVFNLRLNRIDDHRQVLSVLNTLRSKFADLSFVETREVADNNKILQLFRAIAWGTSTIALTICVFVVVNTLLMSVTERKREIGIYGALGWQASRIIMMIAIEAIIITTIGSIAGCVMGGLGLHWLVNLTELRAYIETDLNVRIFAETLLASILLGIIASIYPAWRASQVNPIEALRYE